MAYDIDFEKKGKLKLHIRKFLLLPELWEDKSKSLPEKLDWSSFKFVPNNLTQIP